MKKSITIWVIEGGISGDVLITEAAKKIYNAGFDAVELSFNQKGEISFDSSPLYLKQLYKDVKCVNLEISSLSTLMLNEFSITSSNIEEKKYALKLINQMLEVASIMEIPTVQISPGKVTFVDSYKDVYQRSLEECGVLVRRAEELGITIVIENDWNKFLLSPLEFRDFIDMIDSKNFAACLDTRNTYLNGYPHHWIEVLGERIKKIHLTDIRRIRGIFTEFCDIGTGDIDFDITMKALKAGNYDGYATIEAFYSEKIRTEDHLKKLSNKLDEIVEM